MYDKPHNSRRITASGLLIKAGSRKEMYWNNLLDIILDPVAGSTLLRHIYIFLHRKAIVIHAHIYR